MKVSKQKLINIRSYANNFVIIKHDFVVLAILFSQRQLLVTEISHSTKHGISIRNFQKHIFERGEKNFLKQALNKGSVMFT